MSLHFKKDGTLDMRYNTSKSAMASGYGMSFSRSGSASSTLHYKKDGTLDMRYASSRSGMDSYRSGSGFRRTEIPKNVPVTKADLPDMRTKAAREWVKEQAQDMDQDIPSWIPKGKDGSLDFSKPVTREYMRWRDSATTVYEANQRIDYYHRRLQDALFQALVQKARAEYVEMPQFEILAGTEKIRSQYRSSNMIDAISDIVESNLAIDYKSLQINQNEKLGAGGFGNVFKGTWNGRTVAVKQIRSKRLNRLEQKAFINEIYIMSILGEHTNIVRLYGYVLEPPSIVMEYAQLGSLNYLLHQCKDGEIEAKITDGRIKKKLILGTVLGMHQLHSVCVVHGDLKPHNVLVSKDYVAKITDFGLATLRDNTCSAFVSSIISDATVAICGTPAYMAPELFRNGKLPEYSSDVYSFGIMLNEVVQEEQPYVDQSKHFYHGSPFAVVNYVKSGKRPIIKSKTPSNLRSYIERCWHANPQSRPTFLDIYNYLNDPQIIFPDLVKSKN